MVFIVKGIRRHLSVLKFRYQVKGHVSLINLVSVM